MPSFEQFASVMEFYVNKMNIIASNIERDIECKFESEFNVGVVNVKQGGITEQQFELLLATYIIYPQIDIRKNIVMTSCILPKDDKKAEEIINKQFMSHEHSFFSLMAIGIGEYSMYNLIHGNTHRTLNNESDEKTIREQYFVKKKDNKKDKDAGISDK